MIDLYDIPRSSWTTLVAGWGYGQEHASRLWRYLYREGIDSPAAMCDLPPRLRSRLARAAQVTRPSPARETRSADGSTRKYLLRLRDGQRVETVLMRHADRVTACLSSQVGCAIGCVFCATGQMGFGRNLTTGEIVGQALFIDHVLREAGNDAVDDADEAPTRGARRGRRHRLRNVVLMGMGEPLNNYQAVLDALDILSDSGGLAIGAKQLTLSTVGVVPGIVRLADETRPYSLAVSLHATTQAERERLIPAAKAWPLDELIEACRYYTNKLARRIFFEWTLIAGVNDSPGQARKLAELVHGLPAHVNLIPLNPTDEYFESPSSSAATASFQSILCEHGVPSTVRRRRGIEIAAGCGQLSNRIA